MDSKPDPKQARIRSLQTWGDRPWDSAFPSRSQQFSQHFKDVLAMYYYPPPPYFLLLVGLFAGITSGLAFSQTLKDLVDTWKADPAKFPLTTIRGMSLLVPFLGICVGICFFLSAGVQIFGFSAKGGYAMSIPLTILTGKLVWWQLGKVLEQLEKGGSAALDLDTLF